MGEHPFKGFSHPKVESTKGFDFLSFYFGFGVDIEDPSAKGPPIALEQSFEKFSTFNLFCISKLYSFLISFSIIVVINMILMDLGVVTSD